jgi:hypothetical protein
MIKNRALTTKITKYDKKQSLNHRTHGTHGRKPFKTTKNIYRTVKPKTFKFGY